MLKGIRLVGSRLASRMTGPSLVGTLAAAVLVAAFPATSQALEISYDILITPAAGPSGSGSFVFDDTAGQVLDFEITLGDFGPFTPVGACDGCPFDFSSADTALFFDLPPQDTVLQQLQVPFQGGAITLLLEADGTYGEFNGRASGTYAFVQQPIPEPDAALAFLVGIGVVGTAQRRLRPRA